MSSESLEIGTATSVDQTSDPFFLMANMLHNASLRADHSLACSMASLANSNSPDLCSLAMALTTSTFSLTYVTTRNVRREESNVVLDVQYLTPAFVPENLSQVSRQFRRLFVKGALERERRRLT